jgi:hypothetical protein
MDEADEIQSFPDIIPSAITRGMFYVIEEFDIKTEGDFEDLLKQMFDHPERDFYYFQQKDGARNPLMIEKTRLGRILLNETEFFYYKHPNFKRDYLKIEVRDGQYEFDWEKDVVEKGPMFVRTKLRLTERTKRELETWHKLQLEEEFKKRKKEAEHRIDIFISYASDNNHEATQIYNAITAAGGRAFLSSKTLIPGADFAEEIRLALIYSNELWLLVSPTSLKSDWVLSEWGAAWVLSKKIVPILHRCSPDQLPERIKRLHCIDFYKYDELVTQTFPIKQSASTESPQRWKITQTFKPEDSAKLAELDEFASWDAHNDPKQGFVFPDPKTGKEWLVYCDSYDRDDSDQHLLKRIIGLVHIDDANVPRPEGVL